MSQMENGPEINMDATALTREETYTDSKVGTIRKIAPEAATDSPPLAVTNLAGGPVLLDQSSPDRPRTLLPWFKVEVELDEMQKPLRLGATGRAKFELESESLAQQIYWWLRKRLKKLRY